MDKIRHTGLRYEDPGNNTAVSSLGFPLAPCSPDLELKKINLEMPWAQMEKTAIKTFSFQPKNQEKAATEKLLDKPTMIYCK